MFIDKTHLHCSILIDKTHILCSIYMDKTHLPCTTFIDKTLSNAQCLLIKHVLPVQWLFRKHLCSIFIAKTHLPGSIFNWKNTVASHLHPSPPRLPLTSNPKLSCPPQYLEILLPQCMPTDIRTEYLSSTSWTSREWQTGWNLRKGWTGQDNSSKHDPSRPHEEGSGRAKWHSR